MQGNKSSSASYLPYLLLFPAVAAIILLYFQPFLASFWGSFVTKEGNLGMQNYKVVLDRYLQDVYFTFAVTIFSTIIATLFSKQEQKTKQIGRAFIERLVFLLLYLVMMKISKTIILYQI